MRPVHAVPIHPATSRDQAAGLAVRHRWSPTGQPPARHLPAHPRTPWPRGV